MSNAPLAVIQARVHSTRLPEKMLLLLGGKPLIRWAWEAAREAVGAENVVIACPASDAEQFQAAIPEAEIFGWNGPEADVLGRLAACAQEYRGTYGTVLRVTPDDWPPVLWREIYSVQALREAAATVHDPHQREHIGEWLHQPADTIEINTLEDLQRARQRIGDVQ